MDFYILIRVVLYEIEIDWTLSCEGWGMGEGRMVKGKERGGTSIGYKSPFYVVFGWALSLSHF